MDLFKKRASTSKSSDEKKKKPDGENLVQNLMTAQSKTFGKQAFKLDALFQERVFINPRNTPRLKKDYEDDNYLGKVILEKWLFLKQNVKKNIGRNLPIFICEDPAVLENKDVMNVTLKLEDGVFVAIRKLQFVQASIISTEDNKIALEEFKRCNGYFSFKTTGDKIVVGLGRKVTEKEVQDIKNKAHRIRDHRSSTPPRQKTPPPSPTESDISAKFSDTEDLEESEQTGQSNVKHVTGKNNEPRYKSVDIQDVVKDKTVEELHDVIRKLTYTNGNLEQTSKAVKDLNEKRRENLYQYSLKIERQDNDINALKRTLHTMNSYKTQNQDLQKEVATLKKNEELLIQGKRKLQEEIKNLEKKKEEFQGWCHLECYENQEKLKKHLVGLDLKLKECERSNATLQKEKSALTKEKSALAMELVEEINKSVGDSNVKGESEMNKTFLCSLVLKNQELESRLFKKEESLQCNKTKCGQVWVNQGMIALLLEEIERMKQICKKCDKCNKAYEQKPIKDWDSNLDIPGNENRKFLLGILAKYKSKRTSTKVKKSSISEKEKTELINQIISENTHLKEELILQKSTSEILMKRHLYQEHLPLTFTPKPKKKVKKAMQEEQRSPFFYKETQSKEEEEKPQETEDFKCELCDFTESSAEALWYHYCFTHGSESEKHKWNKCEHCGKVVVGDMEQHHCQKIQLLFCGVCEKAFKNNERKCEHLTADSTKALDSTKSLDSTAKKDQPSKSDGLTKNKNTNEDEREKCPYCTRDFLNKESLRSHMNTQHKPIGGSNVVTAYVELVECEHCFASMYPKNLKRHYRSCKALKEPKQNK